MAQSLILGLDIGSSTVKAVIAELGAEGRVILHAGITRPSRGVRRGMVVDMDGAVAVVGDLLQEVKQLSKTALRNVYLRVGGSDIRVQTSRGITAVARANAEIHKDDIDRVIQASEAVNLPSNRMVLHTLKQEFIVDGVGDIQDPMGMVGARLEVISLIIDAFQPAVANLSKCVELAGGSIGALIFGPTAAASSVLTHNQKELGVVMVDIGYGTTGIAVYEEDKLLHTKVFPFGAGHITSDLAIALKIPVETAEKIKLSYGYALSGEVSSKDKIDLRKFEDNAKGTPSRKFIAEVIESRLSEIYEMINKELNSIGRERKLPAGTVLTGGGAKMPGIVELAKRELKLSTQIGLPNRVSFESNSSSMVEFLESPEYASVLGLTLWSREIGPRRALVPGDNPMVRFFRNFLP
ncbi:MAG: cell division protein FtsA [Candidatus Colwellbacteria bacterium]|nr:cell division protein FtsA [Candidatus Colwellbacteria bacterium]